MRPHRQPCPNTSPKIAAGRIGDIRRVARRLRGDRLRQRLLLDQLVENAVEQRLILSVRYCGGRVSAQRNHQPKGDFGAAFTVATTVEAVSH